MSSTQDYITPPSFILGSSNTNEACEESNPIAKKDGKPTADMDIELSVNHRTRQLLTMALERNRELLDICDSYSPASRHVYLLLLRLIRVQETKLMDNPPPVVPTLEDYPHKFLLCNLEQAGSRLGVHRLLDRLIDLILFTY